MLTKPAAPSPSNLAICSSERPRPALVAAVAINTDAAVEIQAMPRTPGYSHNSECWPKAIRAFAAGDKRNSDTIAVRNATAKSLALLNSVWLNGELRIRSQLALRPASSKVAGSAIASRAPNKASSSQPWIALSAGMDRMPCPPASNRKNSVFSAPYATSTSSGSASAPLSPNSFVCLRHSCSHSYRTRVQTCATMLTGDLPGRTKTHLRDESDGTRYEAPPYDPR